MRQNFKWDFDVKNAPLGKRLLVTVKISGEFSPMYDVAICIRNLDEGKRNGVAYKKDEWVMFGHDKLDASSSVIAWMPLPERAIK